MHVLTKVFLVLAAILCVALSVLAITHAVNSDRVVAEFHAEQSRRLAAEASATTQLQQSTQRQNDLNAQLNTERQRNADLAARSAALEAEVANARTERDRADAARQSIENKIAELGETARTMSSIIEAYRAEVKTLRDNELRYRREALATEDRIADLESQREVLEQNYRALQEQLAEARRSIDTASSGGTASAAGTDQPYTFGGAPISGRVEDVRQDPTNGQTLVRMNVGSNDRVARNMRFFVVRGDQYIATLVVTDVDQQWAVARVQTLGSANAAPQNGDRIVSRFQ